MVLRKCRFFGVYATKSFKFLNNRRVLSFLSDIFVMFSRQDIYNVNIPRPCGVFGDTVMVAV